MPSNNDDRQVIIIPGIYKMIISALFLVLAYTSFVKDQDPFRLVLILITASNYRQIIAFFTDYRDEVIELQTVTKSNGFTSYKYSSHDDFIRHNRDELLHDCDKAMKNEKFSTGEYYKAKLPTYTTNQMNTFESAREKEIEKDLETALQPRKHIMYDSSDYDRYNGNPVSKQETVVKNNQYPKNPDGTFKYDSDMFEHHLFENIFSVDSFSVRGTDVKGRNGLNYNRYGMSG